MALLITHNQEMAKPAAAGQQRQYVMLGAAVACTALLMLLLLGNGSGSKRSASSKEPLCSPCPKATASEEDPGQVMVQMAAAKAVVPPVDDQGFCKLPDDADKPVESGLCRKGISLDSIGVLACGDKSSGHHSFLSFYEDTVFRHLCGRKEPLKVLEMGVLFGASVDLFGRYLGGPLTYVAVDRDRHDIAVQRMEKIDAVEGITVKQVYVDLDEELDKAVELVTKEGPFDVIIEDASHHWRQQFRLFKALLPLVKPGGYYILEDLHTSIKGSTWMLGWDGSQTRQSPLAMVESIGNPRGEAYLPSDEFTADDLARAKTQVRQVLIQWAVHNNKAKIPSSAGGRPPVSVTAVLRKEDGLGE